MSCLRNALVGLLIMLSWSSHAAMISDVEIADDVSLGDGNAELHLNGAALRKKYLIVQVYVGGLYLEKTSKDPVEIIQADGYKRMLFHVLLKRVSARKVANALNEALVINISKDEHEMLKPQIDEFLSLFDDIRLHKGDEVTIDYLPGKGTLVHIPEKEDRLLEGKAFYDALLKVWIGPQPVSKDFKQQMLGVSEEMDMDEES
ncbi:chalcone isomerase family protein [Litoribrevibacter albus]|uniref:Chalcone isomerase n=1 Tax=Litoribrevibacter albus TaxID=1473156 RepID=A0AA37SEM0_9GAMM|nr:chalcone isomerase family protein [Litoribrevibacter albus]GLQ33047.1 chalcone isomerase [Litoribrevibacter albus]